VKFAIVVPPSGAFCLVLAEEKQQEGISSNPTPFTNKLSPFVRSAIYKGSAFSSIYKFCTMTQGDALHSSYIANIVFNAFLCYTAIMLNIITIHAIRKTLSLPKPLKTLLLSLAVSDLGVGLLVQPLYVTLFVMLLVPNAGNSVTFSALFNMVVNLLSYASFFGVTALTVDRFLAIHLHLRYQELVTHKRVVAVAISVWVISAFLSFLSLTEKLGWLSVNLVTLHTVFASIEVSCLITSALLYCKIYLVARHHANQIHALQAQQEAQNNEMANAARLRKSAVGTFYVYLVFLACNLPQNFIYFAVIISGTSTTVRVFASYAATLVFLNSSLNPLIYCWKMRHIRHAVMDILRKIVPSHN